jgi:hypothetical protein
VTLWGKQALEEGAKLEALQDSAPVIAVRSLRVGDYQGERLLGLVHVSILRR